MATLSGCTKLHPRQLHPRCNSSTTSPPLQFSPIITSFPVPASPPTNSVCRIFRLTCNGGGGGKFRDTLYHEPQFLIWGDGSNSGTLQFGSFFNPLCAASKGQFCKKRLHRARWWSHIRHMCFVVMATRELRMRLKTQFLDPATSCKVTPKSAQHFGGWWCINFLSRWGFKVHCTVCVICWMSSENLFVFISLYILFGPVPYFRWQTSCLIFCEVLGFWTSSFKAQFLACL